MARKSSPNVPAVTALAALLCVMLVLHVSADTATGPMEAPNRHSRKLRAEQTYTCWIENRCVKTVTIWWGFTDGDAKYACDNWISDFGNHSGGCYVRSDRQTC